MIVSSTILGSGKVVIILHGLFGEGKNWMSIAKELSSYFEIHLIDQRNHGSSFHHDEHNYEVLVEDINKYIIHNNISDIIIIGHSMGGKVAMNFAFSYPQKIAKLIIVDIAPTEYQDNHKSIFLGLKKVLKSANSRKEAIHILMSHIQDLVTTNFLLKGLAFDTNNKPALRFNHIALENNLSKLLLALNPDKIFHGETYFLSGSQSNYIKDKDLKFIARQFPMFQKIEIDNAGHWVHYENKEGFLHALKKLLNL
tara:strand:+ start:737 stop:1498 length:762 start_codon:yes stop_codon:yes gene_type:complete